MELYLAPFSYQTGQEYLSFFAARGVPAPAWQNGVPTGVWVRSREPDMLVCGTMLYPTNGAYLVVEHVATNPLAPPRKRYAAVHITVGAIETYAAINSQIAMYFPRHKGVERILRKRGAIESGSTQMFIPRT